MENPQIELLEEESPMSDASIVAEGIANSLERFGTARFKGIGHKAITDIMSSGARGVEVLISGKVPSSRAKKWRFYMGYLKKSGDIAVSGVDTAYSSAKLKTGIVGVQVRIMPSSTKMPDEVIFIDQVKLEDKSTGKVETVPADASANAEVKSDKKGKSKSKDASKDSAEKKPRKKPAKKKDAEEKSENPKSEETKSESTKSE
jgi:ribosomal protein S3